MISLGSELQKRKRRWKVLNSVVSQFEYLNLKCVRCEEESTAPGIVFHFPGFQRREGTKWPKAWPAGNLLAKPLSTELSKRRNRPVVSKKYFTTSNTGEYVKIVELHYWMLPSCDLCIFCMVIFEKIFSNLGALK